MRVLRLLLPALLLLATAGAFAQQQGPQNTVFPVTLGGMQLRGVVWYTNPALGFSMRYSTENAIVDVFVYNNTSAPVPEGSEGPVIANELQSSHRAAMEGYQSRNEQAQVVREAQQLTTGDGGRQWRWMSTEYRVQLSGGGQAMSILMLSGHNRQFVKVRASIRTDVQNRPDLRPFANALSALMAQAATPTPPQDSSGSKGI